MLNLDTKNFPEKPERDLDRCIRPAGEPIGNSYPNREACCPLRASVCTMADPLFPLPARVQRSLPRTSQ